MFAHSGLEAAEAGLEIGDLRFKARQNRSHRCLDMRRCPRRRARQIGLDLAMGTVEQALHRGDHFAQRRTRRVGRRADRAAGADDQLVEAVCGFGHAVGEIDARSAEALMRAIERRLQRLEAFAQLAEFGAGAATDAFQEPLQKIFNAIAALVVETRERVPEARGQRLNRLHHRQLQGRRDGDCQALAERRAVEVAQFNELRRQRSRHFQRCGLGCGKA